MKSLEKSHSISSSNGKAARSCAAVVAGLAVGAYAFGVRPRIRAWGATPWEHFREWPGDELTPLTRGRATRALTIRATPNDIWPWILQIGQDRAGFYSYTFLENLFGAEMRNTYRLVPEWQQRNVGDDFWLTAKHRHGGQARACALHHGAANDDSHQATGGSYGSWRASPRNARCIKGGRAETVSGVRQARPATQAVTLRLCAAWQL